MHERILTKREIEAIKEYLKTRKGSAFIYTLRHRAKKFLPKIKDEVELLEKFLQKERS